MTTPSDWLKKVGMLADAKRNKCADRLMAVDLAEADWWLSPSLRERLEWRSGKAARRGADDFKRAAAEVACKRRLRLAFAVCLLCRVGPGAARLARWHDVDLAAGTWTVPRAHVVPAQRCRGGRRARARQSDSFPIPHKADTAFREAKEVGNGWKLLLCLLPVIKVHLAPYGGDIKLPRKPPPPRGSALVFPWRKPGPIRDRRKSRPIPDRRKPQPNPNLIPEHAFRYHLDDFL